MKPTLSVSELMRQEVRAGKPIQGLPPQRCTTGQKTRRLPAAFGRPHRRSETASVIVRTLGSCRGLPPVSREMRMFD